MLKGKIKAYSGAVAAGVVVCELGKKYIFSKKEWRSEVPPASNLPVAFNVRDNRIVEIKAA